MRVSLSPTILHPESASRQRGYNLVEVLIAMALLGTVLLSIVTLFFFGRKNVYSGKQMTQANSVGTSVTEDLNQITPTALYSLFGITSSSAVGNYTVLGTTYSSALVRSTKASIMTSPPSDISTSVDPDGTGAAIPLLTKWQTLLTNSGLDDGAVTMIIRPSDPAGTPLANAYGTPSATIFRITVIVSWREGMRRRQVVLNTDMFRRS